MTLRLLTALAAVVLLVPGGHAAEVATHKLDNGMEVLVRPDHRAPVVTAMVWYRVGGIDEYPGRTGVAHVLEHMMFKGTEEVGPGEFAEIIARNGGDDNAFTGQDYTAYFEKLASDRLEVALRLEADRMVNLLLQEEQFAKETQVVMEERRLRVEDDPRSLAHETLRAVAFDAHGYGQPIIGWMEDLESLELADLETWYDRYYSPRNARLVVAGDVEPEQVFELAEKHFGGLPGGAEPAAVDPKPAPEPRGSRTVDLEAQARVPYTVMAYRVPNLPAADANWEPFALRLLAGILDEGRSARLASRLVRDRGLAASAGAHYGPESRAPGLFYLEGTPAPDTDPEALEQALLDQVASLREEAVGKDELARVKRQIAASEVFQNDSVFYQAMEIGKLETIGYGHEYRKNYLERIRAVTPEQIQKVAAKYLKPQRRTLVRLHPQKPQGAPKGAGEVRQ
ncbi:M16 family metallopeptidase [Thiohalorhabdus sp.]|uniref:M16 family metallopeptidase n=1 Tax=Thiohalorhabdus sp. TaxID=3094134 RepID=UPI002FC2BF2A